MYERLTHPNWSQRSRRGERSPWTRLLEGLSIFLECGGDSGIAPHGAADPTRPFGQFPNCPYTRDVRTAENRQSVEREGETGRPPCPSKRNGLGDEFSRRSAPSRHVRFQSLVTAAIVAIFAASIAAAAPTGSSGTGKLPLAPDPQAPAARAKSAAKPPAAPPAKPRQSAGDSAGSSNGSQGSNFGHDAHLSVNGRTLELTLDVNLVELTGISDDSGLSIGLSYSSADATSDIDSNAQRFGLPYGWKYNVSYIENRGTYVNVVIDGSQSYPESFGFTTSFTPVNTTNQGQTSTPTTGLLFYNRADANLQIDPGTVTVNGITSQYVLLNLDGSSRYFSGNGLLLEQVGRFGDTLQYFYNGDNTPANVLLTAIIDSWGHTTSISYCTDGVGCQVGQVTFTMPDGRTASFVAPDAYTITQITDSMGMVTALQWATSPCEHGASLLQNMSSAAGGMSTVQYQCISVCTQPSTGSCLADGNSTTWPVVAQFIDCPNNSSGTPCPSGSGSDYLTSQYTVGASPTSLINNYTGFPLYSPYTNNQIDPGADGLMASNDSTFTYSTVVGRLNTDGTTAYQVENDYNSLHLQTEATIWVGTSDGGTALSKQTSYCYQVTAQTPDTNCDMGGWSYTQLPANYQSAIIMGSCVYPVNFAAENGNARVSTVVRSYDSFGELIHSQQYFGTSASAVVTSCDRPTRLNYTPLTLVVDDYMEYDTPSTVNPSTNYLPLGSGSGHYGLMVGHQTFSYAEPQLPGVNQFGSVGATTDPLLVHLTCSTLTGDGRAISQASTGLLPTTASVPAFVGDVDQCNSPGWDQSVAPPKVTSFTYDSHGRVLNRTTQWNSASPPAGVSSTSDTLAYTLTATQAGEESCAGSSVLQTVLTDAQGNTTQSRECTLNDFPLSKTDANGNLTTYQHDGNGLTTQVTYPNGTYVAYGYYYQCPLAQDGQTQTCPAGTTAQTNCPYDDQTPVRSCVVQMLHAGTNPSTGQANSSYADGVLQATIKDGLGRVAELRDNLGGVDGAGYTTLQTRSVRTYNGLGLEVSSADEIGVSAPLIYTSTVAYDEKLRPSLVCAPRGMATQFARDDIAQQVLRLSNGTQRELLAYDDGQMETATTDCPLVGGTTTYTNGASCPTLATSTASATCSGNGYYSYSLHDGSGLEHSSSATGSGTEQGASILSVGGVPTYSADSLIYGYSMTTTNANGGTTPLTASSSWSRDLQGLPLTMGLTVTDANNISTTFSSDTYAYNNIAETLSETNKLSQSGGVTLAENYAYTPIRLVSQRTNYDGLVHQYFYDTMDRMARYCYPSLISGVEGENFTYDAITGSVLSVTHFSNPGSCSASTAGDVPADSITYTYTRFGAVQSKTYSNGGVATWNDGSLGWAYDSYQRPVCFADAQATFNGSACPASPADNFTASPDQLLTYTVYWPDSDQFRRGFIQSTCHGVADGNGGFVTKCLDTDYYTAADTTGSCDPTLQSGLTGGYAGATKTTMLCTGGSCLTDGGTPVYTTTYLYDASGRQCSVQSINAVGALILGTSYSYDQFDNLVSEASTSQLDTSTDSNFQNAYTYDGLMRLSTMTRSDLSDNLLETISYTYDAASNITQKVDSVVVTPTSTPAPGTPTPTPIVIACAGDCNGDGEVTIDEIISLVNVALGDIPLTCPSADLNHDGEITMDELIVAINNALAGC